jgi:TRAP transporter 4TM/12TM fusion protein
MISGSGVANVAVDGAITIPLMKKSGYKPADAGAIESVASNGGQFTPPVMGAAAFLMAGLLGVSYLQVCIWAALPAFLYYLTVYIIIHEKAVLLRIATMPKEELPSFRQVITEAWFLIVPVIVIVSVMIYGYSLGRSACVGILATILVSFFRRETLLSPIGILRAITVGVRMTSMISAACILTGVILTTIEATGLGVKLYQVMIWLSGNSMTIGLILAAIIAIILGMGMPTLLVYITMLVFVIPALISLGVNEVAAHFFAFYFGIVSGITPPVCLVAYTAAPLAGVSFLKVGFSAMRIGLASYLLPFMFVINPALLLQKVVGPMDLAIPLIGAVIGLSFFAMGVEGRFLRKMTLPERTVCIAAGGILAIMPLMSFRLIALGLIAVLTILQKRTSTGMDAEEVPR